MTDKYIIFSAKIFAQAAGCAVIVIIIFMVSGVIPGGMGMWPWASVAVAVKLHASNVKNNIRTKRYMEFILLSNGGSWRGAAERP